MKNITQLLFVALLTFSIQLQAQSELAPCGVPDDYYSPWLRAYLDSGSPAPRTDDILYIPLQVHIVGTDEGTGYMSKTATLRAFCTLNTDFIDANIQFFLADEFNYIDNTEFYHHDYSAGYQMMSQNNVNNAINCYIVDSPAGNCGYFAPGRDGIALAKGCTQPADHTWAHEIGHFLSLPHTFRGWESVDELNFDVPAPNQVGNAQVERADGSNCASAGDRFCDTPADYLNYRWSCNSEGLSNTEQIDPTGAVFTSDGGFYMSYSNSACKARFSGEQIDAMRANLEFQRSNLLTNAPDENDIVIPETNDLTVVSPIEGELIESASVRLEWAAIPNATHYILQVNPFPMFNIVFNQFVVEGTSFDFTNLIVDETFFWRVKPYNPYFSCHDYTEAASFSTGSVVSVLELEEGESIRLFPNPVKNGYIWMEVTSLSSNMGYWEISDVSGRMIKQGNEYINTGVQKLRLETNELSSGMYIASLQLGDKKVFRKFIVE